MGYPKPKWIKFAVNHYVTISPQLNEEEVYETLTQTDTDEDEMRQLFEELDLCPNPITSITEPYDLAFAIIAMAEDLERLDETQDE